MKRRGNPLFDRSPFDVRRARPRHTFGGIQTDPTSSLFSYPSVYTTHPGWCRSCRIYKTAHPPGGALLRRADQAELAQVLEHLLDHIAAFIILHPAGAIISAQIDRDGVISQRAQTVYIIKILEV